MMNTYGLKRKKGMLIAMADPKDAEFNAVIQEAVKGINRLLEARSASGSPPAAG